jgi:hypothetical protein
MSRPSATQSPTRTISLLLAHQGGAHAGVGRHPRGVRGHLGRADLRRDVATVEQHALADLDLRGLGHGGGVVPLARGQCDGAVHRPRVEVREPEPLGHGTRHGRLAGARGTVDRDDHGE